MEHVAIDLGSRESHICRRASDGAILESKRTKTASLKAYFGRISSPARVIIEASAEAFQVADWAQAHGHDARVVPSTLSRTLGVGARGVKNDERDAHGLSEVSCRIDLPSIHLPSRLSREQKALAGSRDRLVAARTMLINRVRGYLRNQTKLIAGSYTPSFPDKVSVALTSSDDGIPQHIERLLLIIEELTEQIQDADKELLQLADNNLHQRLMTVPGVGPVTATRFKTTQRPLVQWALRIKERHGSFVAVTPLARKMTGILYAIRRDDTRYDPTRGAAMSIG